MRPARAFLLCSTLIGSLALPAVASASTSVVPVVTITAPADGALVAGVVEVVATTDGTVVSVAFDWSDDGGASWQPIGTDPEPADGWTASWDTDPYSGPALVRATASTVDSEGADQVAVTVDNAPPSVGTSVTKDPMSPNGDQIRDRTTFVVTVDEASALTVLLRGPQGGVVKHFRDGGWVDAGTYRYEWAGFLPADGGGFVKAPDGKYTLDVTAVDEAGNEGTATDTVVVDTKAPTFSWRSITPNPVTGTAQKIHMAFHVADVWTDRITLSFTLLDEVGVVRTVAGLSRLEGDRAIAWLPRYRNGDPLIPGNFRVRMKVKDDAGNSKVTTTRLFRVVRPVATTVYRRLEGTGSKVALTFDDCVNADAWDEILDTLAARGVKATFFCNGTNVDRLSGLASRTYAAGHSIGSHTYDHAYLPGLGDSVVRAKVVADQQAWARVAGITPAPYFRPPYGAYTAETLQGVEGAGFLRTMMWDVDPLDWTTPGASVITSRVVGAARGGSVILLHVLPQTADALGSIITGLANKGLSPVTLPVLFRAAGMH